MTSRQKAVLGLDVSMAFMQTIIDLGINHAGVKNIASLLNDAALKIGKPLQNNQLVYLDKLIDKNYPKKHEVSAMSGYQYFSLTLNVLIQAVLKNKPTRKLDFEAVELIEEATEKILIILEDVNEEDLEIGAIEADLFIKKLKLA